MIHHPKHPESAKNSVVLAARRVVIGQRLKPPAQDLVCPVCYDLMIKWDLNNFVELVLDLLQEHHKIPILEHGWRDQSHMLELCLLLI